MSADDLPPKLHFRDEPTLFILGAGTSNPSGFLTVKEYTQQIAIVLSHPNSCEAGTYILEM